MDSNIGEYFTSSGKNKTYDYEESKLLINKIINDNAHSKRSKYITIRNLFIHCFKNEHKRELLQFCTIFDNNQKKNFLEFKTGMGKDSDDDDEIYSGMYLGHGEWDTASGFEEAEYNDDD